VKVAGQWRYVYRAVDQFGQVVDVFVSPQRDTRAARRFFEHAIGTTKITPVEVVTDHAPLYPGVLEELAPAAWHRTDQYANNRVEADHGRLKARPRPMRGFKRDRSARIVIAGHAFVQNVRPGYDEVAVEEPVSRAGGGCVPRAGLGDLISEGRAFSVPRAGRTQQRPRTFPPDLVDRVVEQTGRAEQRRRLLPARVVVSFVLALALYGQVAYEEVMRCVVEGLGWAQPAGRGRRSWPWCMCRAPRPLAAVAQRTEAAMFCQAALRSATGAARGGRGPEAWSGRTVTRRRGRPLETGSVKGA
jgi:hypothetical protein